MEFGFPFEAEIYSLLETPEVELFGAAAKASGRPFVNIVELVSTRFNYAVVIELPHVKCYEGEVEWTVNDDGEVTIEGQIKPGEIFADVKSGLKRRRVQLCPTEPWAIVFNLPGPVEWWTTSVVFTSSTFMELTVRKDLSFAELARIFAAVGYSPETPTSPMDTTSEGSSSSDVSSPGTIDFDEMIAGLFSTSAMATNYTMASTSAVASSPGVSSPIAIDFDDLIAGWFSSSEVVTGSVVVTTTPMASTSAVATTSSVASTSVVATTSAVASSSGVSSPRATDIDEMIA